MAFNSCLIADETSNVSIKLAIDIWFIFSLVLVNPFKAS